MMLRQIEWFSRGSKTPITSCMMVMDKTGIQSAVTMLMELVMVVKVTLVLTFWVLMLLMVSRQVGLG
jgi:hypothetical protein